MGLHLGWIPNEPGLRAREYAAQAPGVPDPVPTINGCPPDRDNDGVYVVPDVCNTDAVRMLGLDVARVDQ